MDLAHHINSLKRYRISSFSSNQLGGPIISKVVTEEVSEQPNYRAYAAFLNNLKIEWLGRRCSVIPVDACIAWNAVLSSIYHVYVCVCACERRQNKQRTEDLTKQTNRIYVNNTNSHPERNATANR